MPLGISDRNSSTGLLVSTRMENVQNASTKEYLPAAADGFNSPNTSIFVAYQYLGSTFRFWLQLQKLHISNQTVDISDIIGIMNDVEELSLDYCQLSVNSLQKLFATIAKRQNPVSSQFFFMRRTTTISQPLSEKGEM